MVKGAEHLKGLPCADSSLGKGMNHFVDQRAQVFKNSRAKEWHLGANPVESGVHFRVWAPQCRKVEVVLEEGGLAAALPAEAKGYFSGMVPDLTEGALYKFRLDGKEAYPDPCSRYQPQGPHGPSMVVNPGRFPWTDKVWQSKGIGLKGQVIYEVHVGAFSPDGTFAGLMKELDELKRLGITLIEIMPIHDFPGKWNWGYDGVNLFAPAHVYGTPDDLRHLVDRAHRLDIGVILDVVYNHLGPDGNYLQPFSRDYFTDRYWTDWGEAVNFDGPNSPEVREFFLANACSWIREFHLDGLRLDATQNIYDQGKTHILAELSQRTRAAAAPKSILLIAENESQEVRLVTPLQKGGYGFDAVWNDDFHHAAQVAVTGRREAYYTDYLGRPQDFIASVKHGYLYQGQFYSWQNKTRGTYVGDDIPAASFVVYLQNHDQVANSLDGKRITHHIDEGVSRALTTLLLLGPQTPLLFMGQEFAASTPFLFFADHHRELAALVFKGRKEFLSQFPSIAAAQDQVADPSDPQTFEKSKLKFEERQTHRAVYQLHQDLLKLRREDPVFHAQDRSAIEGAVLTEQAFALRFKGAESDRLLVINLGTDVDFTPCSEPLLAPRAQSPWQFVLSSEDPRYGGQEIVKAVTKNQQWFLPGRCAQIFKS